VIENPLTGERISVRRAAAETGGAVLEWDLLLAPGGHVPSAHAHPAQEERFHVRAGRMRFRVGRRILWAGPGATVVVPPGTVHHFSNPGAAPALVTVETRPALAMEHLLEAAAAMAHRQWAARRALPNPVALAMFMEQFRAEVRAPYVPRWLVRAVTAPLAATARPSGARVVPRAPGLA
jgi:mannose-6-phosphate isomerase-like protein (cupin superfamily)